MPDPIHRFLCIASYEKGQDFMRQCAEMGVKPTLLTVEKLRDAVVAARNPRRRRFHAGQLYGRRTRLRPFAGCAVAAISIA